MLFTLSVLDLQLSLLPVGVDVRDEALRATQLRLDVLRLLRYVELQPINKALQFLVIYLTLRFLW